MSRPRMRPQFSMLIHMPVEEAEQRVLDALKETECCVVGGRVGPRIELRPPKQERHYWSPHLSLVFEEEDGHVIAHGRFGPAPQVWTTFMALYGVFVLGAVASLMFGMSQWMLGELPTAFYGIAAAGGAAAFVYLSAFYGQGLGGDQMYVLRNFLGRTLDPRLPCGG